MFASPAFAQAAGTASPSVVAGIMQSQLPLFLMLGAIFYFLTIRPQQQRAKAHRAMIDAVKKGDEVVTGGGIVGKVVRVTDGEVEIDAGNNVKFRVLKGTLSDVRDRAVPAAANDLKG